MGVRRAINTVILEELSGIEIDGELNIYDRYDGDDCQWGLKDYAPMKITWLEDWLEKFQGKKVRIFIEVLHKKDEKELVDSIEKKD